MKLIPSMSGVRASLASFAGQAARALDADFWGRWGSTPAGYEPALSGGGRGDGMDSVWTHVAVSRIADTIRQQPWRLALPDNTLVESGPLVALLSRPNPVQDWSDFVESLVKVVLGPRGAAAIILDYGRDNPAGETQPLRAGSLPVAMRVDSADSLTPIWAQGPTALWPTLVGYEYRTRGEEGHGAAGGRIVRLPAHQVVMVRIPDGVTLSPTRGLSPRVATGRALALDRSLESFATDYFASGAHPSREYGTDASMTLEQRRSLQRDLDRFSNGGGRGRGTRVLPKGLKPVSAQASLRDAAHPELSDDARERQLAAYGVSPIVAGIVDSANRSNSDAQMLMFLSVAVVSLASRIAGAITRGVIAAHDWPSAPGTKRAVMSRSACRALGRAHAEMAAVCGQRRALARGLEAVGSARLRAGFSGAPADDLVLFFDFDSHPVIMESKLAQIAHVAPLLDNGATLNEVMDLLDVALERNPAGDVARVPFSKAPADIADEPSEPAKPAAPEKDKSGNAEGAEGAEKEKARGEHGQGCPCATCAANPTTTARARGAGPEQRTDALVMRYGGLRAAAVRGVAQRLRMSWVPLERLMQKRYEAFVAAQGRGVLERLKAEIRPDEMPGGARAIGEDRLTRIVFDLREAQEGIEAVARPILRETSKLGAAQGLHEGGLSAAEAAKEAATLIDDPLLRVKVRESVGRFRLIEESRREDAMRVIREAFLPNEGESPRTFADLVADLEQFYDGARGNAKRTATTETGKVLNGSRHEGMRAAGTTGKHWLTTSGDPRPTHAAAEAEYGETAIPIDQPFRVGESALQYPGDPAGEAREIIQCLCVSIAGDLEAENLSLAWMGVAGRAASNGAVPGTTRGEHFVALDAALARYAAMDLITADDLGLGGDS